MKFLGNTSEYLQLETIGKDNCEVLKETVESSLTILWFEYDHNVLAIDGQEYIFNKNEIVFFNRISYH
ncbi:hypothetical protein FNH22_03575 [Fulvivirga sp. M361]|uniref:hypothetical protein n=1 Tax=Fulvivirga sp. M361 TaxID=2594266 RepID=UPI00117B0233|nr:hypothetical protein [Fulvivirga sp. M361]TRX61868.1 hypothetical protein FNH22_03575 [Fulvivirga sp. M361]